MDLDVTDGSPSTASPAAIGGGGGGSVSGGQLPAAATLGAGGAAANNNIGQIPAGNTPAAAAQHEDPWTAADDQMYNDILACHVIVDVPTPEPESPAPTAAPEPEPELELVRVSPLPTSNGSFFARINEADMGPRNTVIYPAPQLPTPCFIINGAHTAGATPALNMIPKPLYPLHTWRSATSELVMPHVDARPIQPAVMVGAQASLEAAADLLVCAWCLTYGGVIDACPHDKGPANASIPGPSSSNRKRTKKVPTAAGPSRSARKLVKIAPAPPAATSNPVRKLVKLLPAPPKTSVLPPSATPHLSYRARSRAERNAARRFNGADLNLSPADRARAREIHDRRVASMKARRRYIAVPNTPPETPAQGAEEMGINVGADELSAPTEMALLQYPPTPVITAQRVAAPIPDFALQSAVNVAPAALTWGEFLMPMLSAPDPHENLVGPVTASTMQGVMAMARPDDDVEYLDLNTLVLYEQAAPAVPIRYSQMAPVAHIQYQHAAPVAPMGLMHNGGDEPTGYGSYFDRDFQLREFGQSLEYLNAGVGVSGRAEVGAVEGVGVSGGAVEDPFAWMDDIPVTQVQRDGAANAVAMASQPVVDAPIFQELLFDFGFQDIDVSDQTWQGMMDATDEMMRGTRRL